MIRMALPPPCRPFFSNSSLAMHYPFTSVLRTALLCLFMTVLRDVVADHDAAMMRPGKPPVSTF